MNWYLVKIVFRIITEEEAGKGLFEEKLRLINSKSREAALMSARKKGEEESSLFINASGHQIEWQFIAVSELKLIEAPDDGVELDSHLIEMPCDEFISLLISKEKRLFSENKAVVYT